ncbi:protein-lysine methyltransferase METTL21D [Cinnamomum micranthum f. kanehirae]|uniref:Protein-lysine methyltransferase METTL21D n=1 Tax=Cinnamomum micranthum f. kanehirae TaxID=337451 RepID=A0A3S3QS37_9MAGN|nr:protein-lysine methyltransferase METTL21D [Cinnamomum micranthum f. kanehirae]
MRFTDSPVIDLQIGDTHLSIEQDNASMHVGTSVWPCSLVLAKFVERWLLLSPSASPNPYSSSLLLFPNKRAVELGAGCGPAGMALSLLGLSNITLTDIAPVMPALKRNLKRNRPALQRNLKTAVLYWNNHKQLEALGAPFDFVIAADVVYLEDGVPHLVSAMEALVAPSGVVLLGYQLRSPEAHQLFWELAERVFSVEKVPHEHLHPDYAYEETDVYILRKK